MAVSLHAALTASSAPAAKSAADRKNGETRIDRLLLSLGIGRCQRLVVAQMPSFGSLPALGGMIIDSGNSTTMPSALMPRRKSTPGLRNALASGLGPIFDSGP